MSNNNYNELITEFQQIIDMLEGIAPSPDSIDANLDSNSQRPVQNRTIKAALDNKADKSQITSLARVATTGSYTDLSNTPNLQPVATSGSYNDLSDRLTISTDMSNETTNTDKVTSPKAVADYVTAYVAGATGVSVDNALNLSSTNPVQNKVIAEKLQVINGGFTPNFTMETGSYFKVSQIGNVVYLEGYLAVSGSFANITGSRLGYITGVDGPSRLRMLPVNTTTGSNAWTTGVISIVKIDGDIQVYIAVEETDSVMTINGFYTV